MEADRKELLMKVDGMTCQGCAKSVQRSVQRLDPDAQVEVDLPSGRVTVHTRAEALDVAQAITKAGYEARAMTL